MRYVAVIETNPDFAEALDEQGDTADRGHDAYVRVKIARGLEQSRQREAMIPVEQVLRDLSM